MNKLTFDLLREANSTRLPLFKNSKGLQAHSKPDGSDWSPAQWLQAVVGELGEYANVRKKYERGDLSFAEFAALASRELADVQIYLDLLALQLGIDLGAVTIRKFNEVSMRVKANVLILDGRVLSGLEHEERVVGHLSGWKEHMGTCTCGGDWPCSLA